MNIKKESIDPFSATVTLGLELGYTGKSIEKTKIIECIQDYQNELIQEKDLVLSASLSECTIVLSGQVEPHFKLNFINYPKFPMEEHILKIEIENLTKKLMEKFQQNRVVIEYFDETILLEKSALIDPRIMRQQTRD